MTAYSRHRHTDDAYWVRIPWHVTRPDGSWEYSAVSDPMQYSTRFRDFSDNPHTGKPDFGQRYPVTDCHDVRVDLLGLDTGYSYYTRYDYRVESGAGPWPVSLGSLQEFAAEMGAFVGGVDGMVLHKMLTTLLCQLPPDMDLGNFLWELREAETLVPSLIRRWEVLNKHRPHDAWKIRRTDLEQQVRRSDLEFADASLWWQFGVAPFLSDLDKISQLGNSVGAKLEQLRKLNGRTSTRRAGPIKLDVTPALPPWQEFARGGFWGGDHPLSYRIKSAKITYRASAKLVAKLVGLEDWEGITAAWLAATGLNNPMAIVFESLPCSFILDWFAPVGDRLRRAGATPIAGVWHVSDACWTRKVEIDAELRYSEYYNRGNRWVDHDAGIARYREFTRGTVFPDFPVSWPLTAGQAELALALAISAMG